MKERQPTNEEHLAGIKSATAASNVVGFDESRTRAAAIIRVLGY